MRKRNILWIVISLIAMITALPAARAQGPGCVWGVSTLRGDATYPPGWEKLGGTLDVRRPFVRLHSDGSRLYIKGVEFEVWNSSTIGENNAPNPLIDGVLSLVVSYLQPDGAARVFQIIPYTHVFEKGESDYYQVQYPRTINSGYVRLTADIPDGEFSTEQYFIPAGARDLSLFLFFTGTFEIKTPIAVGIGAYRFDPVVQNNTRLAYSCQTDSAAPGNIYLIMPDGNDERNLTQLPDSFGDGTFTSYVSPAWSPDGTQLAIGKTYCSETDPNGPLGCSDLWNYSRNLLIVDLGDDNFNPAQPLTVLTFPDTNYGLPGSADMQAAELFFPSYSPDGSFLACAIGRPWNVGARRDLAVFDIATGQGAYIDGVDNIIYRPLWSDRPAWSPDGQSLAYFVDYEDHLYPDENGDTAGFTKDIWHMDLQMAYPNGSLTVSGTSDLNLTPGGHFNGAPTWSPDSQWLVFPYQSETNGLYDLWIMDRSGGNRLLIYAGFDDCANPRFSPDGTRIAFRMGNAIYVIDLNGQNPQLVKTFAGDVNLFHDFTWSPFLDEFSPTVTLTAERVAEDTDNYTLSWTSASADRVLIDNGIGDLGQTDGSITVYPVEDTTYMVSAFNWAGRATASVRVTVKE